MKRGMRPWAGVLLLLSWVGGCTSTHPAGSLPGNSAVAGQAATTSPPRDYDSACAPCHDRGGFGVRVLADRLGSAQSLLHAGTRMPPEAIRVVVRRGLGAMPAMSRAEVSDGELEAIIAHLSSASGSPR